MYYIILDMEWNQALDRAHTVEKPVLLRGEIIQIGAVKADEHFELVDTLKINVAPKYSLMRANSRTKISVISRVISPTMVSSSPFACSTSSRCEQRYS